MNIDGSTGTTIPTGPTSPQQGDGVDKQAFLQLLIAQLQNQDPLSPMEGTEFVNQMATFTQVEQQIAQSKALDLISLQLTGLASNEAVSLIGKDVTVRGNKVSFDGENTTGSAATFDRSAADVTVTIRDENGQAVRTLELGPTAGGAHDIPWDGRDDNGQLVKPGSFSMEISARDAEGGVVGVSQDVAGRVVGVSFEKGFPEMILDSGARAPISDLISVSGQAYSGGAAAAAAAAAATITSPGQYAPSPAPATNLIPTATE